MSEILVNLKFSNTEGPTDLCKTTWSSKTLYNNEYMDSVDCTAGGRFDFGESAYFNGEYSILTRNNGNAISSEANKPLTLALWINTNFPRTTEKIYLLKNNYKDKNYNNSVYYYYESATKKLWITATDNTGVQESVNISKTINDNEWNFIFISLSPKLTVYANGVKYSYTGTNNLGIFNFGKTATIGYGYDKDYASYTVMKAYIDDFTVIKDLKETEYNPTNVPTTYLSNLIDYSLYETNDTFKDTEKEYSRYTQIEDLIEQYRPKTKERIDQLQNGLVPYVIKPTWYQIKKLIPMWNEPDIINSYTVGDTVKLGFQIYTCLKSNTPSIPGSDNTWRLLVNDYSKSIKEWVKPNPEYMFGDIVLYFNKLFKNTVNYNNKNPAPWVELTNLLNTEKTELNDPGYTYNEYTNYSLGDKINFNGKYYESTIDDNVGNTPDNHNSWEEISGDTSKYNAWVQPNAYKYGDIVEKDNDLYYSFTDHNSYVPSEYTVEWIKLKNWVYPEYKNRYYKGDEAYYLGKAYICTSDTTITHPNQITGTKYARARTRIVSMQSSTASMSKEEYDELYGFSETNTGYYWQTITVDAIPDTSTVTEYVYGNEYKKDDIVKINLSDWKAIAVDEIYFKNRLYTTDKSYTIQLRMDNLWDNHFFNTEYTDAIFEENYLAAYNASKVGAYLLFINNRFIPWDKITIIRSDNFVTLRIDNKYITVKSVKIICIPFKVEYSTTGYMPDKGVILFSFNTDGTFDGPINIYSTNSRIKVLQYNQSVFSNFYLDIGLDTKITSNNIFVFNDNEELLDNNSDNYTISSANMLNVKNRLSSKFRVYVIWDSTTDKSEDNLSAIPNSDAVREYLDPKNAYKYVDYKNLNFDASFPINVTNLGKEFDKNITNHTYLNTYNTNITNSLNKIFNYNKSKYDKIYEDVRPINIVEYDELQMNSIKRTIRITITEDNINSLLGNYILEGTNNLILLTEFNKDRYMNKSVRMKLRKTVTVKLNEDNINKYLDMSMIVNDNLVILTDSNKKNYLGQKVDILQAGFYTNNDETTDTIIMSRDIYDKEDTKNDTYVWFFKHGMLPKWYNTIQYTPNKFYFTDVPQNAKHYIYFGDDLSHQYIIVTTSDGRVAKSTTDRYLKIDDGTDLSSISINLYPNTGFTVGSINNIDAIRSGLLFGDITLTATPATINWYKVVIDYDAKNHQYIRSTITGNTTENYDFTVNNKRTIDGVEYTYAPNKVYLANNSSIIYYVPYGTTIENSVIANYGYTAGRINSTKLTVTGDAHIYFTASATPMKYTVTMINTKTSIYKLHATKTDGMSGAITEYDAPIKFSANYNDTIELKSEITDKRYKISSIDVNPVYNIITVSTNKYIVTGDLTVSADSNVSVNTFTLSMTNNYISKGTIVSYVTDSLTNKETKLTNTSSLSGITYGSKINVSTYETDKYYAAKAYGNSGLSKTEKDGELLLSGKPSPDRKTRRYGNMEIVGNASIELGEPELKMFQIVITQREHELITVAYTIDGVTTNTTKTVKVPYGTTYNVSVTTDKDYIAGELNTTSGTVTNNVNISIGEAHYNIIHVTVASGNETLRIVSNGKTYTSSFTAHYNDKWQITGRSANNGYILYPLSATSGTFVQDTIINGSNGWGGTIEQHTSGTYTFTLNTKQNMTIEVAGAGGGGGGSRGSGGGNDGGHGGCGDKQVQSIVLDAGTYSYTVGAGGAAGSNYNSAGSAGGSSSFSNLITAAGGPGGTYGGGLSNRTDAGNGQGGNRASVNASSSGWDPRRPGSGGRTGNRNGQPWAGENGWVKITYGSSNIIYS